MMTTLQDGNRVLQEQIDRLNQELRDNEDEFAKQLELSQQPDKAFLLKNKTFSNKSRP